MAFSDLVSLVSGMDDEDIDYVMNGVAMNMAIAGSGNHGVTAILPVAVFASRHNKNREETAKAVAFSHLATIYIKNRTGKLTPTCGCTIAAGAGAVEAYHAALLIIDGHSPDSQGLVDETTEKTVDNIVHVSAKGMENFDRAIIEIIAALFA